MPEFFDFTFLWDKINVMRYSISAFLLGLILSFATSAQVTTSSISGYVRNDRGAGISGANITAIHVPTGSVYSGVSRAGGRFDISNVNPGGPYSISASNTGYETEKKEGIFLVLGQVQGSDFVLLEKVTQLSEVVISGRRTGGVKNGIETSISREKLAILPSVGRGIYDYVRYTPQTKYTQDGGLSIGGQNNRYNGFLIDGAVNNDVFGLSAQGTNGGRASVTPISIDAVDQIVVQLSPYDAALGNFTGGAINAITKSGTNEFHGSAYYIFRNENLAGKTPGPVPDSLRKELTPFTNKTYGFTLGGPIIKNKSFFFVNLEMQDDSRPQPYTPTILANNFNIADTVSVFVNHLKNAYGYDPGDYLNNPDNITRTNLNTRLDFNLSSVHKLTASYRYTKAERTNPARSSNTSINFTSGAEYFPSTTHSGSAELNSKFSNKVNNKFRFSFTDVVDDRGIVGTPFPAINLVFPNGLTINAGSEASSTANLLKQRIINFYDAFKIYSGKHELTAGLDIDLNKSYNLFINRNYGFYTYTAIGPNGPNQINPMRAFMENRGPQRYRRGYSLVDQGNKSGDDNTAAAANFNSVRYGFFVNDDIRISPEFTLTVGVRADKTSFLTDVPEDKFFNDTALPVISRYYDLEGARSGGKISPRWQVSPRIGFRYNIPDENMVIRGGFGIFGGRTPLVWPGGLYQNNGITVGLLDTFRTNSQMTAQTAQYGLQLNGGPLAFNPDVNQQLTQEDFGLPQNRIIPQGDMNIIAKDFHLPAVAKISIGADRKFGKGWTFTIEALYTQNIHEVDWVNVNFEPAALKSGGPGSRTVYSYSGNPTRLVYRPYSGLATVRNPYGNVILIRNTSGKKGYSYNLTAGFEKQAQNGLFFSAFYTYGSSRVPNEGTSSINTSNWANMESVSGRNYLGISTSDFDLGHRIYGIISKKFTYYKNKLATTVSFAYNGQSGNPFSYTYSNRAFVGDGVTFNDLMYVPLNRAEMQNMVFLQNGTLTPDQQRDQFEAFIQSDKYLSKRRGQFAERNGARLPFTNIIDMNIMQDFTVKVKDVEHKLSVRLDIFNFTNFIDKDAGRVYFLNFDQAQVLSFEGFSGSNPQYRYNAPANNRVGNISDGVNAFNSSRWNGQATIRYSF